MDLQVLRTLRAAKALGLKIIIDIGDLLNSKSSKNINFRGTLRALIGELKELFNNL